MVIDFYECLEFTDTELFLQLFSSERLAHLHDLGMLVSIHGDTIKCERTQNAMTDDLRQLIREYKADLMEMITHDEQPQPEPPSYIKRCDVCGGTNWGQIGTQPDGIELWGCLDCIAASPSTDSVGTCSECHGSNLVTDAVGKFCVDCCRRPWEHKEPEPAPEPKYIGVRWGSEQGWLRLINPVSGEVAEVVAKGLPRWIFDRRNGK
jgi:TubC N-terminal docking domain